jgi:hypothetical protein
MIEAAMEMPASAMASSAPSPAPIRAPQFAGGSRMTAARGY